MEGLSDATSAGVRDMCANVIRELLDWSMRQRSDKQPAGNSKQLQASSTASLLMRGLHERLAHPEPYMRFLFAASPPLCFTVRPHISAGHGSSLSLQSSFGQRVVLIYIIAWFLKACYGPLYPWQP